MPKVDVERDFRREGEWIVPTRGTWGRKAQNLWDNREEIENQGFQVAPRNLVIPCEYYSDLEGPVYYVLDWINHFFPDIPVVGVSSNSPDEDVGERTPGLYSSKKLNHLDRGNSELGLQRVINSYHSDEARTRRARLKLPEQGMSLLVRPFIKEVHLSGSFSHFGTDRSLLVFTDPKRGMESMQSPKLKKLWVDKNGEVCTSQDRFGHESVPYKLNRLARALRKIPGKGWEIEFLATANREGIDKFYIMQTTPINEKPRFEVKLNDRNCLYSSDFVGFGKFETDGILYIPTLANEEDIRNLPAFFANFEKRYPNYLLATVHPNIKHHIERAAGAKVLLNVCRRLFHPLSAHIDQAWREKGAAFAGYFENDLGQHILTEYWENPGRAGKSREFIGDIIYSPTKLLTQVDEFGGQYNVEVVGDIKPFQTVDKFMD